MLAAAVSSLLFSYPVHTGRVTSDTTDRSRDEGFGLVALGRALWIVLFSSGRE